jgi:hypothetical protein
LEKFVAFLRYHNSDTHISSDDVHLGRLERAMGKAKEIQETVKLMSKTAKTSKEREALKWMEDTIHMLQDDLFFDNIYTKSLEQPNRLIQEFLKRGDRVVSKLGSSHLVLSSSGIPSQDMNKLIKVKGLHPVFRMTDQQRLRAAKIYRLL